MRLSTLALCSALLSGTTFAQKQPETSHLPAAVQQRIKEYHAEGDLKKIKTRKQKDGSTVYEVEYKERGNTEMLVLAEDGSVISESSGKGKSNAKGKGQAKKQDNKGKGKGNKGERDDEARDEAEEESEDLKKKAPVAAKSRPVGTQPVTAPLPPTTAPGSSKSADATANVPPTPTTSTPPVATSPGASTPSETIPTASKPARPVLRPTNPRTTNLTTRPTSPAVRPVAIDRLLGETRYVSLDKLPQAVRTAALAQQAQQGQVNARLLRAQKKGSKTIYHVPFNKGTVSFNDDGSVAVPAAENGGPVRTTRWDDLPEAVRKSATAAQAENGEPNQKMVTYQSSGGKSLYHISDAKEMVHSYSQDGKVQDPATYWK